MKNKINNFEKNFLNKYFYYNIKEIVFNYYSIIEEIYVGIILDSEEEKKIFIEDKFSKFKMDFVNELRKDDIFKFKECSFCILSYQEINEKYDGNVYYAMK